MEERGFVLMSRQLKCIGILCMLFVAAVNSCPDENGVSMDCNILPTVGLTCTYVKGSPKAPPTDILDVPGAVDSLNVSLGFASDPDGVCESRLNITWTVSADGSLQYLRGFFLVISFYYEPLKQDVFLNRTFTVNTSKWTPALSQTLFTHQCVIPAAQTSYRVQLFSLPQNLKQHNAVAAIRTANTYATDNQCERTGNPKFTYNWTATMWTSANPSTASIEVCFYTAPPSFKFSSYLVSILPNKNDLMNMFIEQKNLTVDPIKKTPVCEKFVDVCSGDYKIYVMPDNNPVGTCHNGEKQASCTATVVDSINMTESECRRRSKNVSKPSGKK